MQYISKGGQREVSWKKIRFKTVPKGELIDEKETQQCWKNAKGNPSQLQKLFLKKMCDVFFKF